MTYYIVAYDPIKHGESWFVENNRIFMANGYSMEILGVTDKVLANGDILLIERDSKEDIINFIADTQRIRITDKSEEQ